MDRRTSCSQYSCRAQPLLRSLARASKRAEKEAAEWEAAEAAAASAAHPSSNEGTPAPQQRGDKAAKSAVKVERASSHAKGKRSRRSGDLGSKASGRLSEGPTLKKPRTGAKQVRAWIALSVRCSEDASSQRTLARKERAKKVSGTRKSQQDKRLACSWRARLLQPILTLKLQRQTMRCLPNGMTDGAQFAKCVGRRETFYAAR